MSTMEPSMIELIKAINELKKQYERAQKLDFVKKPIAYALYQTWKIFDKKGE